MFVDLTKDPTRYSHYLKERLPEYVKIAIDPKNTVDELKSFIYASILLAKNTDAKNKFVIRVSKMQSKEAVIRYVRCAIKSAENYCKK